MGNKDNSPSVGVITHIDGKPIHEISRDDRKKWIESLNKKIRRIEGVSEVILDAGSQSLRTACIVAYVESEDINSLSGQIVYDISINLRSVSQRLTNILDNDRYASCNIVQTKIIERPEKNKKRGLRYYHNQDYYRIELNFP